MSFELKVPLRYLENEIFTLNQKGFTVERSTRDVNGDFFLVYSVKKNAQYLKPLEESPVFLPAKKSHSMRHKIFKMFHRA